MNDTCPPALFAGDAPSRTGTVYPSAFAPVVAGRRKQALGDLFGLTGFGVNRTVLPPGAASALKHRHSVQDEFVYVLEGELVLIHDAGETPLRPGMCAGFVAGGSAHRLVNRSEREAIYLEIGDRRPGDAAEYPDDDLQAVHDGTRWRFRRKDGRPYED